MGTQREPSLRLTDNLCVAAGLLLAVLTGLWAAITYFSLRASGVTGSDPYAYVQMGVDLARHGTLLHTFPLAPQLAAWHLPSWPAVPVGYRPPDPSTGQSATVWPPGYGALLALAYLAAGEAGLYLLPPLIGCLALAALWALGLEVLRPWPAGQRFLAAGLAVFVLATSYRQVEGAALPMADIPSQLFTLLAVYCTLRVSRSGQVARAGLVWAGLSGLCLGLAFSIRYTQVLVSVSLLFLLAAGPWQRGAGWRAFLGRVLAFGLAAWLSALPTLWYHAVAFGQPFAVGSAELGLFGIACVPATVLALARELFRTNEFLYLAPFLLWGLIRMSSRRRKESAGLALWLGVLLAFHLPYPALRARDLLSVFPVLALWAGAGAAEVLGWAFSIQTRPETCQVSKTWQVLPKPANELHRIESEGETSVRPASRAPGMAMALLAAAAVVALFGARVRLTLQWPLHPAQFNTFGYLNARQRAAFDDLRRLTPPEAVVAASLNSGAVDLYSQREAVRPGDWTPDEWRRFVSLTLDNGRPVYLLVDGEALRTPEQTAMATFTLKPIAALDLPYFYPDGSSANLPAALYRIAR